MGDTSMIAIISIWCSILIYYVVVTDIAVEHTSTDCPSKHRSISPLINRGGSVSLLVVHCLAL